MRALEEEVETLKGHIRPMEQEWGRRFLRNFMSPLEGPALQHQPVVPNTNDVDDEEGLLTMVPRHFIFTDSRGRSESFHI